MSAILRDPQLRLRSMTAADLEVVAQDVAVPADEHVLARAADLDDVVGAELEALELGRLAVVSRDLTLPGPLQPARHVEVIDGQVIQQPRRRLPWFIPDAAVRITRIPPKSEDHTPLSMHYWETGIS